MRLHPVAVVLALCVVGCGVADQGSSAGSSSSGGSTSSSGGSTSSSGGASSSSGSTTSSSGSTTSSSGSTTSSSGSTTSSSGSTTSSSGSTTSSSGGTTSSSGGTSSSSGSTSSSSSGASSSGGSDPTVSINAGGAAIGTFVADVGFTGGETYTTTNAIDTALLTGAAPDAAVFQTERWGEFTYTIPDRTPNSAQTVTLYFAETLWTTAGARTFDVVVNGVTALAGFDIFAEAGGANRAIAKTFDTIASATGQVVIAFRQTGPDHPKLCALTVAGGGGGTSSGGSSSGSSGGTSVPLTVTRAGTGSGTVTSSAGGIACGNTCTATFPAGSSVTLTAAAASGSSFAGWGGACSGAAPTCTLSMTAARSVTATFDAGSDPRSYQPCPATGDCRILPLGDSITDGFNVPGGYRIELFRKAHAAGRHVTFVGSGTNGPPTVDGVKFPQSHEGHSGWIIDQIAGLVPSPALNLTPHIVLLMAGTNDVNGNRDLAGAPGRLNALLGKLFAGAPDALVVVAQLTPTSDRYAYSDAAMRTFNAALPAIVDARVAEGKHVLLVDMRTGFPASELADGLHPNEAGYARMASVWYDAIGTRLR